MILDNGVLLHEFKNLLSNGYLQVFVWLVFGDIVTGLCKGFLSKKGIVRKDY